MSGPTPNAAPIKRNVLSYQQKREIIQELESGAKNVDVCKKFGLPSSSVATIWRFRHKILAMEDIVSPTAKRARMCHKVDVDQAVYEWCRAAKAEGVRLSVALLKSQAEKIAQDLGHANFQCSNGWLYRFRLRHNINIGKPRNSNGEKPAETPESEWLKMVWEDVLKDRYDKRDIYCAHEVGLFFEATPNMTAALAQEKCEEGQLSSYRMTMLLCCNMDGSHKRPLVVVGSGPSPDFNGMIGLPVTYVRHPKSWMTTDIFEREMFLWDEELRLANKRILLLVNTSSAHIRLNSLESIHLCFLPREAPGLQPIERGVSRFLRSSYRRQLLTRMIQDLKADRKTQITLLDALKLVNYSWECVTPEVVMDSFLTAGYIPGSENSVPLQHSGLSDWMKGQNTDLQFEDLDAYEFVDDGLATSPPDVMPEDPDEQLVTEVCICNVDTSSAGPQQNAVV